MAVHERIRAPPRLLRRSGARGRPAGARRRRAAIRRHSWSGSTRWCSPAAPTSIRTCTAKRRTTRSTASTAAPTTSKPRSPTPRPHARSPCSRSAAASRSSTWRGAALCSNTSSRTRACPRTGSRALRVVPANTKSTLDRGSLLAEVMDTTRVHRVVPPPSSDRHPRRRLVRHRPGVGRHRRSARARRRVRARGPVASRRHRGRRPRPATPLRRPRPQSQPASVKCPRDT